MLYVRTVSAMLVHALRLRLNGVKLTPAALRTQRPLAGRLSFNQSAYQGRDERGLWVCTLMPELGESGWSVELFVARVLRILNRHTLAVLLKPETPSPRCTFGCLSRQSAAIDALAAMPL
jgi:hypothetical protein